MATKKPSALYRQYSMVFVCSADRQIWSLDILTSCCHPPGDSYRTGKSYPLIHQSTYFQIKLKISRCCIKLKHFAESWAYNPVGSFRVNLICTNWSLLTVNIGAEGDKCLSLQIEFSPVSARVLDRVSPCFIWTTTELRCMILILSPWTSHLRESLGRVFLYWSCCILKTRNTETINVPFGMRIRSDFMSPTISYSFNSQYFYVLWMGSWILFSRPRMSTSRISLMSSRHLHCHG